MAIDLGVFGPATILVQGTAFGLDPTGTTLNTKELGLAAGQILLNPQFSYRDIRADDFGSMPPETFWMGGICFISFTLVDFDPDVYSDLIQSAMGDGAVALNAGQMMGAGLPMGGNTEDGDAGNNYIGLIIHCENPPPSSDPFAFTDDYTFPSCHLTAPPFSIPLGAERSLIQMAWRSIPYNPQGTSDLASKNSVLWTRT